MNATFVIAEPNALVTADLADIVEATGGVVLATARSTAELRVRVREHAPDAVIMEYWLPGAGADDLLADFESAGVPVVLVTGMATEDLPGPSRLREIVLKPFTQRHLLAALTGLGLADEG